MADEAPDKQQKTLDPSVKRYKDAYKKGQAPISRDVNNFVFLGACLGICLWVFPWCFKRTLNFLAAYISNPCELQVATPDDVGVLFKDLLLKILEVLWIPFLVLILVAIAIGLIQSYKAISTKSIQPQASHISLLKGIQRIFGMQSLVETLKSTVKLLFLGVLFYLIFKDHTQQFSIWIWATPLESLMIISNLLVKYLSVVLIFYAFVSGFDMWYQRHVFKENIKMTVQEQRDESKEQEGDPKIRLRVREVQRERSRNRMLDKIPKATVIVTNPTHFSVALSWEEESMDAPIVVAKGADVLALKIREIANAHKIPMVENAPVARSLYDSVNIDQQIPPEYYKVVAEVIRLAMRIRSHQF